LRTRPFDEALDLGAVLLGNHGKKKLARDRIGAGSELRQCPLDAFDLNLCQFVGQADALGREIEAALATIFVSGALDDEAFVHELLQNAGQTLFGNLQDIKQLSDLQAGISMHEMQDPVVGAAETVLREKSIGIAGEIAISEIEKFDAGDEIDAGGPSA